MRAEEYIKLREENKNKKINEFDERCLELMGKTFLEFFKERLIEKIDYDSPISIGSIYYEHKYFKEITREEFEEGIRDFECIDECFNRTDYSKDSFSSTAFRMKRESVRKKYFFQRKTYTYKYYDNVDSVHIHVDKFVIDELCKRIESLGFYTEKVDSEKIDVNWVLAVGEFVG